MFSPLRAMYVPTMRPTPAFCILWHGTVGVNGGALAITPLHADASIDASDIPIAY